MQKVYHSKRPHRKSRAGCRSCKTRKVKCDEGRPSCRACTLRRDNCVYLSSPTSTPTPSSSAVSTSKSFARLTLSSSARQSAAPEQQIHPLFRPVDRDDFDMRLLSTYTSLSYRCLTTHPNGLTQVDHVLKVKIVEHAFSNPFLMNCLLSFTATHINRVGHENMAIPSSRAIYYRARAFESYRRAIEAANPSTFPALVACSLVLCAVSSEMFRDEDAKPLYILDWLVVWRGIGLLVGMTTHKSLFESGLRVLFMRPPIDLDAAAMHVPNNLLFMVMSIADDDADASDVAVYYDTLRYLGSLYQELYNNGFNSVLDLRIVTFFTFLPARFIELARAKRPRALTIIAHHLVFAKLVPRIWWMQGISDPQIQNICHLLGGEWDSVLRVPTAALELTDLGEIAKLLFDDPAWEPPSSFVALEGTDGLALKSITGGDPIMTTSWVQNDGTEIDFVPLPGTFAYRPAATKIGDDDIEPSLLTDVLPSYSPAQVDGMAVDAAYDCIL
ncbi:hypothetical protein B0T17DRAFT_481259 [Bombardia bombarda]|uniref:Zn(2)-C6 fungal-type domain-containing protein n=1 Tax=Bombardia bombarda TaxID=252184 RepID=A0AA39XIS0_9PEZI|nr:hypothetical protein B0T17DRAFT_481259 [Bombardia bombarda]